MCVLSRVPPVRLGVAAAAAAEELKEQGIKLAHSWSLIKCVTCFTDEF